MTEPFSHETLCQILELDPMNTSRLRHKESNSIEFKRSFSFHSFETHARTLAAFANSGGGHLVFGIDDTTREVVGLLNDQFDRLDSRLPTEFLNSRFAPEIRWSSYLHRLGDKEIGLIYVFSAQNKPVIATANGERIREGEIFFRYNGQTAIIKYAELRAILDEERRKEQELWLKHLQRLATIGVDNAAVLSLVDGTASGKSGAFVIDSAILPKLQFIREGEFEERAGAPTVRVIGDAEILAVGNVYPVQTQVRPTFILPTHIIEAYLQQTVIAEPIEYIVAICHEQSPYLPVYYFARLAGLSMSQLAATVENSHAPNRHNLLRRLREDVEHIRYYRLPKSLDSAVKRTDLVQQINTAIFSCDGIEGPTHVLEAIQLLRVGEFDHDYVLSLLRDLYDRFSTSGGNTATLLRKAICHIDYVENRPYLLDTEVADSVGS